MGHWPNWVRSVDLDVRVGTAFLFGGRVVVIRSAEQVVANSASFASTAAPVCLEGVDNVLEAYVAIIMQNSKHKQKNKEQDKII